MTIKGVWNAVKKYGGIILAFIGGLFFVLSRSKGPGNHDRGRDSSGINAELRNQERIAESERNGIEQSRESIKSERAVIDRERNSIAAEKRIIDRDKQLLEELKRRQQK